jgi:hypothetical protein
MVLSELELSVTLPLHHHSALFFGGIVGRNPPSLPIAADYANANPPYCFGSHHHKKYRIATYTTTRQAKISATGSRGFASEPSADLGR